MSINTHIFIKKFVCKQIAALEEELQIEAKQQAQLRGTLDQTKSRNEDLKSEISKLQKKLRELQQTFDSQVQEWSERKYTIDRLEDENAQLRADLEKLRRQLVTLKGKIIICFILYISFLFFFSWFKVRILFSYSLLSVYVCVYRICTKIIMK